MLFFVWLPIPMCCLQFVTSPLPPNGTCTETSMKTARFSHTFTHFRLAKSLLWTPIPATSGTQNYTSAQERHHNERQNQLVYHANKASLHGKLRLFCMATSAVLVQKQMVLHAKQPCLQATSALPGGFYAAHGKTEHANQSGTQHINHCTHHFGTKSTKS